MYCVLNRVNGKRYVGQARDIYRLGCWLLAQHRLVHRPLRLLGLGVSGLQECRIRQLVFRF